MDKKVALEVFYFFEGRGIQPGNFNESLIRLIAKADSMNSAKLSTIFPDYAEAVRAYKFSEESYKELEALAFGD